MPKFQPIIEKKYEIHLKDYSGYVTSAKTIKEAKKRAKEWQKERQEEWKKEHSKEKKRQERLEFIEHNLGNLIDHLRKQLWHDTRSKRRSEDYIKLKKELRELLIGINNMKKRVQWHQSHFGEGTYYSIESVKKEDD